MCALEVLCLNKVLQSSPVLSGLKKLAIPMIPIKQPLSKTSFIHLFIHSVDKHAFIQDLEQGTGLGIGNMGGKKTFFLW